MLKELRGLFSEDIGQRIIGITPSWRNLPEPAETIGFQRHAEVEGWLRQAAPPRKNGSQKWGALDDKPGLFKPFLPNIVRCDTTAGIDEAVLLQLRTKPQG